ncbi:hypothetical protein PIB30_032711 [Stylosanthes scabra]|uniref:Uncharacterized protein n=1 Tax=Stylosanthes scabra TaxID=79078 RepID=A0ABU6RCV4_9FABA|nr:hypothetical protein [Stylosanthes scabra]
MAIDKSSKASSLLRFGPPHQSSQKKDGMGRAIKVSHDQNASPPRPMNVPSRVWDSRCNRMCQDRRLEVHVRGSESVRVFRSWKNGVFRSSELPRTWKMECSDLSSCRIAPSRGVHADLKGYFCRLGEEVALSSSGGRSSSGPSCVASCLELGGSRDFVFPYRGKDLFKVGE